MEFWIDVVGWIGGLEVIVAYFMINQNRVDSSSTMYQVLNLTGAALLIVNTMYYKAYPSSLINLIWVGIAIYGLIKRKSKA